MQSQNTVLECEVKLKINSSVDYWKLATVLPPPRRWGLQLNVYLDSADGRLGLHHVSLRIRVTPDHARLTMKMPRPGLPVTDGSGSFVNEETEVAVSRDMAIAWIQDPASAVPASVAGFEPVGHLLGGATLVVTTWSLTRRAICDTCFGVTLELDETVFSDGFRDFEIEAEFPDARKAHEVIQIYASHAGVALSVQNKTKHKRAAHHRGDTPYVIPCGQPFGALPPFFMTEAPVSMFGIDQPVQG
jgi:uncharacterized protein YjbK